MLTLVIPETKLFNNKTNEFIDIPSRTIKMEHSLVAVSKWESKFKKAFLGSEKTREELLDYFKCMTITQNIPDDTLLYLDYEKTKEIIDYIGDSHSATWFNDANSKMKNQPSKQVTTAEVIYGWMVALRIDKSYEKWHLNQLLTLIKVCDQQQNPPKKRKMSAAEQRNLNRQRLLQNNTKG